jgi:GntR family uxuAB operon transcriptional repressor
VTNSLWNFIESERLLPGDRLLPERELAERLGLPRTALRRMLSELEAAGTVVREVGRGTFFTGARSSSTLLPRRGDERAPVHTAAPLDRLARTHPAEVFETRLIVEPKAALLAAQRAAPEDMREMEIAITKGRAAHSFGEFEHWDAAFHNCIVRAARNELLLSLYDIISSVRAGALWGRLKEQSLTPERMASYVASHEDMLAAIRDRDHLRAEAEMAKHISDARSNMFLSDTSQPR